MNTRKFLLYPGATALGFALAAGLTANIGDGNSNPGQETAYTIGSSSPEQYAQGPRGPASQQPPTARATPTQRSGSIEWADPTWRDPNWGDAEPDIFGGRPGMIKNAATLLDQPVVNQQGEQLGAVVDFILDANSGRVEFLAVGPGESLRVVPPQAFQVHEAEEQLTLNITSDQWDEAPSIQRQDIGRLATEREAQGIYQFYGANYIEVSTADVRQPRGAPSQGRQPTQRGQFPGDPDRPRAVPDPMPRDGMTDVHPNVGTEREFGSPQQRPTRQPPTAQAVSERERAPGLRNPRMHGSQRAGPRTSSQEFGAPQNRETTPRTGQIPHGERLQWASNLIGKPVTDGEQQLAGEVSDFIVDLEAGEVLHVIVSHDPEHQFAIPMQATQIDQQGNISVQPTLDALRRAPRYNEQQATLRPNQPFRYDQAPDPEFGAPERRGLEEGPRGNY